MNPVPGRPVLIWCVGDVLAKRQGGAFHLSACRQVSAVLARFSDPGAHGTGDAGCTSTVTCLDRDSTVTTFVSEVI